MSAPAVPPTGLRGAAAVLGALAVVLVAVDLRPAVVALSPLLGEIRADLGLSATAAGLLTTLPVLCFGLLAPVAPAAARRWGMERVLVASLAVLCAGFALRLATPTWTLFAGTILAGCGIAVGNVLAPALIKRDFAHRLGVMTGLYSMALSGGAALAAGLTLPVAEAAGLGWRGALAVWALPAVAALLVWLPRAVGRRGATVRAVRRPGALWRSPLAWAVTVFMGAQSLVFYATTAWLPEVFVDRGTDPVTAGWLLAASNLLGIVGSFVTPVLAGRMRRQRAYGVGIGAGVAVACLGLALVPAATVLWVALLGLSLGSGVSLALLLMALRAHDAAHTSELSGMAQSAGYVLAAVGPFGVGFLHDATGSWSVGLGSLAVVGVVLALAGWRAGRDEHVVAAAARG